MNAMHSNDELMNQILKSPAGQQAAAQLEAEKQAARRDLYKQIAALRKARGKETAALELQGDEALAEVERIHASLQAAQAHQAAVAHRIQSCKSGFDARIRRLEVQLEQSAPAAIADFIAEMRDEESRLLKTKPFSEQRPTGKVGLFDRKDVMEAWSELPSHNARLAAIRGAVRAAEGLRRTDCVRLDETLQALRVLPEVVLQKVEGNSHA
jgi:hypothetical protein